MSRSQPVARAGTRGYAHLVEARVPIARVWHALTDPRLVRIWTGREATIDLRRNGVYHMYLAGAGNRDAQIDIIEERRRLRLIYLPDRSLPPTASAIVDDILIDVRRGDSLVTLRVLGSGIPETREWDRPYMRIRTGWERQLARLKRTLENPPARRAPLAVALHAT